MTGLKIALTGAVLFVLLVLMHGAAKSHPPQPYLYKPFAFLGFIAFLAIFFGAIYQIWSS